MLSKVLGSWFRESGYMVSEGLEYRVWGYIISHYLER